MIIVGSRRRLLVTFAVASALLLVGADNDDGADLPNGFDLFSPATELDMLPPENGFNSGNGLASNRRRDPLSPLVGLFPQIGNFGFGGEADDGKWTQKDAPDEVTIVGVLPESLNPKNMLVKADSNYVTVSQMKQNFDNKQERAFETDETTSQSRERSFLLPFQVTQGMIKKEYGPHDIKIKISVPPGVKVEPGEHSSIMSSSSSSYTYSTGLAPKNHHGENATDDDGEADDGELKKDGDSGDSMGPMLLQQMGNPAHIPPGMPPLFGQILGGLMGDGAHGLPRIDFGAHPALIQGSSGGVGQRYQHDASKATALRHDSKNATLNDERNWEEMASKDASPPFGVTEAHARMPYMLGGFNYGGASPFYGGGGLNAFGGGFGFPGIGLIGGGFGGGLGGGFDLGGKHERAGPFGFLDDVVQQLSGIEGHSHMSSWHSKPVAGGVEIRGTLAEDATIDDLHVKARAHTVALTERHRDHRSSNSGGGWGNAIESETRVIHIPFDAADGSAVSITKSFDKDTNEAVIHINHQNSNDASQSTTNDSTISPSFETDGETTASHFLAGASGGNIELPPSLGTLLGLGAKRFLEAEGHRKLAYATHASKNDTQDVDPNEPMIAEHEGAVAGIDLE